MTLLATMEEPICFSDLNCSNPSQIIKLNVGGCKFTTTVATLTCVGASYFDALFSGRWKQHLTEVRSAGVNKLPVTCLSLYTSWQRQGQHNSSNADAQQQGTPSAATAVRSWATGAAARARSFSIATCWTYDSAS